MTEMIERVARALAWRDLSGKRARGVSQSEPLHWTLFEEDARTAIEAMREPTDAMIERAAREMCRCDGHDPDGGPKWGFGWLNYKRPAEKVLRAALTPSQRDEQA